jgi:hypothetical protein
VSYGEPQSTFWSSAATFSGGAVVGGLLGYAIGDDWFDDDNNDDIDWDDIDIDEDDLDELRGRRGGVTIEDSTIVVGGDRVDRDRVQTELRSRRGGGTVTSRPSTRVQAQAVGASRVAAARPQGVAPARTARAESVRATKQVAVPNSRRAASAVPPVPTGATRVAATPSRSAARPGAGLAADLGQGHAARKEAQRGAVSRGQAQQRAGAPARRAVATAPRPAQPRAAVAQVRSGSRAAAPTRAVAPTRRSGGGLAAGFAKGDKVRHQADRGRASRAGGRRG